ncbi:hypothetical protein R3P38DRAFT_3511953, partial [Favolaschia claudopus]
SFFRSTIKSPIFVLWPVRCRRGSVAPRLTVTARAVEDGSSGSCILRFDPNLIAKKGVSRVNRSQRVPKASREMVDEPEESALTAEFTELIITVIEIHIKKFLPEEYSRIEIYASRLPLNERSPAYPFGGYVINLRVCTEGHQDDIDHEMCVSVGGEIALFEEGLVFRTRQWDALIFHSRDSTHFNLHVKGTRISIVLQSNKHGKKWVENKNNWVQSSY